MFHVIGTDEHDFKQSNTKPTSEVKFHTHHDIIDELKRGIKKEFMFEMDYFQYVQSNLVVIFPSEDLLNSHSSKHFMVAPRKHDKIRAIEPKWQDKQLQATIFNLITHDQIFALLIPIDVNKDCLFKNHQLFPYFTLDSMIASKLNAPESLNVAKTRWKYLIDQSDTITILQENGLKNMIDATTKKLIDSKLCGVLCYTITI